MAGKFGSSAAWSLAYTYAAELFPTVVRSTVLGLMSQAGGLGGIAAPLFIVLGAALGWPQLPYLIMGVTSLVAAAAFMTLPETCGLVQPDTLEQMLAGLNSQAAAVGAVAGGCEGSTNHSKGIDSGIGGGSRHSVPWRLPTGTTAMLGWGQRFLTAATERLSRWTGGARRAAFDRRGFELLEARDNDGADVEPGVGL